MRGCERARAREVVFRREQCEMSSVRTFTLQNCQVDGVFGCKILAFDEKVSVDAELARNYGVRGTVLLGGNLEEFLCEISCR